MDTTTEEYIQGIGNEVFYFFLLLSCLLVVVGAWYSTQVLEPVVTSVILVDRAQVRHAGATTENESRGEEEYIQHTSENQIRPSVSDSEALEERADTDALDSIPLEDKVTIRLKFLNESQKDVEASLLENIGSFKRRNFTEELSDNKNVRLIFNGQVLREEQNTLRSYGIFDKCVVHCLIHQQAGQQHQPQRVQQPHQHREPDENEEDFDVSEMFIPVLGVGLIFLWYFAFTYSAYFNMMSSTALLGLTSLFLLSVYGTNFHVNLAFRAR